MVITQDGIYLPKTTSNECLQGRVDLAMQVYELAGSLWRDKITGKVTTGTATLAEPF
jgi:hypothetical protein